MRMAELARNVAPDLQAAASRELVALANELGMTAFLVAFDGEAAVTLASADLNRPMRQWRSGQGVDTALTGTLVARSFGPS
ncbi:hypothetical protein StoSoilB20_19330 [Arthrobacter sp. StoSoilB20]|nr:hypothetical protein StoSoilB20_19330 [Arthrobacter sp. StoSoilB20]